MSSIRVLRQADLQAGLSGEGMARASAAIGEDVNAVIVKTEPGMSSGWHHHGDHTTYACVLQGRVRIEWGPGGRESAELGSGDFWVVPPNTVHREDNPGSEQLVLIGIQFGSGAAAVSADGPDQA